MTNRSRYRLLFCLLPGLFCLWATVAAAQDVRFEHVTVEDGLSNNSIYAVLEDSRGYLWVGTQQGLNRYDGYGVKVYRPISGDTTSLSADWVIALQEGRDGTLWVGTGSGLNRFEPQTGTFTSFQHRADDSTSLSDDQVMALHEARDGTLWVGTLNGFNRFDPQTEIFTRFLNEPNEAPPPRPNTVLSILEDTRGVLWVGTHGGGLNRFDPRTETFIAYRHREGDPTSLSDDGVYALHQARDGTL